MTPSTRSDAIANMLASLIIAVLAGGCLLAAERAGGPPWLVEAGFGVYLLWRIDK